MEEEIEIESIELFPIFVLLSITVIICVAMFLYFKYRNSYGLQESNDSYLQKVAHLSHREKQVLDEIVQYKSQKEIAKILFIEVSTVKSHANKIYKVFDVKNRHELLKVLPSTSNIDVQSE